MENVFYCLIIKQAFHCKYKVLVRSVDYAIGGISVYCEGLWTVFVYESTKEDASRPK